MAPAASLAYAALERSCRSLRPLRLERADAPIVEGPLRRHHSCWSFSSDERPAAFRMALIRGKTIGSIASHAPSASALSASFAPTFFQT